MVSIFGGGDGSRRRGNGGGVAKLRCLQVTDKFCFLVLHTDFLNHNVG